jgi:PBP1b-binding outer membrane lipoprotein LpoB
MKKLLILMLLAIFIIGCKSGDTDDTQTDSTEVTNNDPIDTQTEEIVLTDEEFETKTDELLNKSEELNSKIDEVINKL